MALRQILGKLPESLRKVIRKLLVIIIISLLKMKTSLIVRFKKLKWRVNEKKHSNKQVEKHYVYHYMSVHWTKGIYFFHNRPTPIKNSKKV